ncbi:large-conductance mechanosensitive channel protein MscL, partial [Lachnospiraceae bacterium OttesenSCG-928-E19]|nr:large-conductance mechanosensitive channel protein MscL [Lachnospiraceae bacterium OttesenSCG-928-E19]
MAKKGFIGEFKEFINKGSAIDMAVGIIVGSAMTGVVNSLVKDVIMPPIGMLIGGVDFSNWFIVLRPLGQTLDQIVEVAESAVGLAEVPATVTYKTIEAAHAAGATTLNIGLFLNTVVSFFITMFAIFLFVKAANKFRRQKDAAPATTRSCPYCKTSIDRSATKCPNCCSDVDPLPP